MRKILIVEDDKALAKSIIETLKDKHECVHIESTADALDIIAGTSFDLFIIDLNLQDGSGHDICEFIREFQETPIMVITVRSSLFEKLKSFKIGVNDYLCKPFNLLELKARVNTLLKCNPKEENVIIEAGNLKVDVSLTRAYLGKKMIKLRKKECLILAHLAQNAGIVVSRQSLINSAWRGERLVESNSVDVHIRGLRKKIGKRRITTIYGVGYKLEIV